MQKAAPSTGRGGGGGWWWWWRGWRGRSLLIAVVQEDVSSVCYDVIDLCVGAGWRWVGVLGV